MVRQQKYQRYKRTPMFAYKKASWSLRKKNPNPKSAKYWLDRAVTQNKKAIVKGVQKYTTAYSKAVERMQKRAETAKDPMSIFTRDDVGPELPPGYDVGGSADYGGAGFAPHETYAGDNIMQLA